MLIIVVMVLLWCCCLYRHGIVAGIASWCCLSALLLLAVVVVSGGTELLFVLFPQLVDALKMVQAQFLSQTAFKLLSKGVCFVIFVLVGPGHSRSMG
jgi:hypothetical protein